MFCQERRPRQPPAAGAPDHATVRRPRLAGPAHALGQVGARLPYARQIQESFGRHSVEEVEAHIGGGARHALDQLGARALAHGTHVAFPSYPDLRTAAHESAHVIQQRLGAGESHVPGSSDDVLERQADAVADRVIQGRSAEDLLDQPLPGLTLAGHAVAGFMLQPAAPAAGVASALAGRAPWTRALAEQALNAYSPLSPKQRDAWVQSHRTIKDMLATLDEKDTVAGGRWVDLIRDILQRVQLQGANAEAVFLGVAGMAGMARQQSQFMHQRNVVDATAKAGGKAPTASQIAAAQQAQVDSTSISPQTAVMSPQQAAQIDAQVNQWIPKVVAYATTHYPALQLKASQLRADAMAVHARGLDICAMSDNGQAVLGKVFLSLVQRDIAYVIPTLVHEIFGHPEYGTPELGLEVYDKAAAQMPGYAQPTGNGRLSELDAYGYQETEIYSLLREVAYFKPVSASDQASDPSLTSYNYDPAPVVADRIGLIKDQFARNVALSLIRGLALRIHADPRLSSRAKKAFDDGVRQHFKSVAPLLLK